MLWLCLLLIFVHVGISYFVYGEKIKIYTDIEPEQKEFMEAGLEFVGYIERITNALPLYKLFPTKVYKKYVGILKRMNRIG